MRFSGSIGNGENKKSLSYDSASNGEDNSTKQSFKFEWNELSFTGSRTIVTKTDGEWDVEIELTVSKAADNPKDRTDLWCSRAATYKDGKATKTENQFSLYEPKTGLSIEEFVFADNEIDEARKVIAEIVESANARPILAELFKNRAGEVAYVVVSSLGKSDKDKSELAGQLAGVFTTGLIGALFEAFGAANAKAKEEFIAQATSGGCSNAQA